MLPYIQCQSRVEFVTSRSVSWRRQNYSRQVLREFIFRTEAERRWKTARRGVIQSTFYRRDWRIWRLIGSGSTRGIRDGDGLWVKRLENAK